MNNNISRIYFRRSSLGSETKVTVASSMACPCDSESGKFIIENIDIIELDEHCTTKYDTDDLASTVNALSIKYESVLQFRILTVIASAFFISLFLLIAITAFQTDSDIFSATNISSNSGIIILPPPKDLNKFCEIRFISTSSGYSICEELCKEAECCSLDSQVEGNCFDENRNVCNRYNKHCSPIFEEKLEEKVDLTSLENICSSENLSTESGKAMCFDACSPASCCFEDVTESSSCRNDEMKLWCEVFSECEVIFGEEFNF